MGDQPAPGVVRLQLKASSANVRGGFEGMISVINTTASDILFVFQLRPREIPAAVKRAVKQRDQNRCVACGGKGKLHLDHILPFFYHPLNTNTSFLQQHLPI